MSKLPEGITVLYPPSQCGMNFVADLAYASTTEDQIKTLDFAFNHWGKIALPLMEDTSYGKEDYKSQVFFTDTVDREDTRWPEIKKLCFRGPVTPNARYEEGSGWRKNIAVYVLTREKYYEWRDEYVKNNPINEDDVEEKKTLKELIEEVPAPPAPIEGRGRMFFNFNNL